MRTTLAFRRIRRKLFGRRARLRFDKHRWEQMIDELHQRGERRRESGAFLLALRGDTSGYVSKIVYLDDLDPNCLVGGIHFDGKAYSKLWSICDDESLQVIADIHTHPQDWVEQSKTDRANPMVSRNGHLGLIAPNFASGNISPADLGVHEYRSEAGWQSFLDQDAERLIYVGRFA